MEVVILNVCLARWSSPVLFVVHDFSGVGAIVLVAPGAFEIVLSFLATVAFGFALSCSWYWDVLIALLRVLFFDGQCDARTARGLGIGALELLDSCLLVDALDEGVFALSVDELGEPVRIALPQIGVLHFVFRRV